MALDYTQRCESENNEHETNDKENLLESHIMKEKESSPIFSEYDNVNGQTENELKNKHENTTFLQDHNNENELKSIGSNKKKHKSRKRITVIDSDSEDDMNIKNFNESEDITIRDSIGSNETEKELSHRKSRKLTMFESDSENEIDNFTVTNEDCGTNTTKNRNISRNKINFDESDLETDDKDEKPVEQDAIYAINSDGKLVAESSTVKNSTWAALCDSESSGPENSDKEQADNSDNKKSCTSDEIIKPIKYKKRNIRKDESQEMSFKEASKQRDEIRSESQRMLRESNISLPYHRPKSFTLKDFLAKRPKFASAVPLGSKMPTSMAIKMSVQQLEVITKNLEERHKEVREFYKSDNEEEDDEDPENNEVLPDSEKVEETNLTKSLEDDRIETNYIEKNIDDIENINEALRNGDNFDVNKNLENIEEKNIEIDSDKINSCKIDIAANNSTDYDRLIEENENINKIIEDNEYSEGKKSIIDYDTLTEENENINKTIENNEGKKIKIISEFVIKDGIENNSSIENILTEEIDTGLKINMPSNSDSLSINSDKEHVVGDKLSNDKNVHETNLVVEPSSINYEFNLDDIEENSENILNNDKETQRKVDTSENLPQVDEELPKKHSNQFVFGEIDKEIENFGNNEELTIIENQKFKLDRFKSRLSNITPRLSGDLNHLIDLDDVVKPNEVTKLMERFAQHTAKIIHHKDRVQLNIVSVEHGGEIHKETLAVRVDDEEDLSIEEKPGARLQKLRNELQNQIAQRKSEIWQQKAIVKENNQIVKDPYDDEKSECGADDAILDDDEEEEMSESSEEDEEEEIEEDTKEKRSKEKSIFVHDEADVDDEVDADDEADIDDEIEEYQEHLKSDEENDNVGNDDNDDSDDVDDEENKAADDHENNVNETSSSSKPLRRIIQCFSEDSDEDEDFRIPGETIKKIAEKLNRSNEDTNNTQEDYIRPYQLQNLTNKTPIKSISESSNNALKFLTPVSYITGLQNLTNSVTKVNVPSPLKETDWHAELERKLHADSIITNSQAVAMRELFTETFSESQDVSDSHSENVKSSCITLDIPPTVPPNTQDILNICSGRFDEPTSSMPPSTQDILNICSGKFTGISQVSESIPNIPVTHKVNRVEEVKYLSEDQDMVISQLINEEEMAAFKKKFDSPVLIHNQKVVEEVEEVERVGGIIDSDEEVLEVKKKKRNQKKLTFSDDESSNEDEEKEEEIDLHDNIEGEECEINYDSEENEVDYSEEKVKENLKMADFFEAEAELSESEWGSADEDEKDLDTLEFEQGDTEKFDEKQLRTDLERIHMRRLLDDDTREVKLLQEMLLDDGELHGTGRERQFKWKTIDSNFPEDDDAEKKGSDDENCVEDENEEQWRKKRHEREMFLKEKNSQETKDDDLLSGSEILKLGHKVIRKSMSNSQEVKISLENPDLGCSPAIKKSFSLLHKRGSFLTRGDQVLERLAEFNKTATLVTMATGKAVKNSKNFLFQRVGQETVTTTTTTSFLNLKRKADDGTPKVIKKLRLTDNLSPALDRKKTTNKQIKTKLFGTS